MKPASIKAKGRDAENFAVALVQAMGWPYAERRRLTGAKDRGDITGIPKVVLEIKSGARITLPEWLRETETERVNDGADIGALIVKLKGMGEARVADWPVMLPLGQFLRLLREAGYQVPLQGESPKGTEEVT